MRLYFVAFNIDRQATADIGDTYGRYLLFRIWSGFKRWSNTIWSTKDSDVAIDSWLVRFFFHFELLTTAPLVLTPVILVSFRNGTSFVFSSPPLAFSLCLSSFFCCLGHTWHVTRHHKIWENKTTTNRTVRQSLKVLGRPTRKMACVSSASSTMPKFSQKMTYYTTYKYSTGSTFVRCTVVIGDRKSANMVC